MVIINKQPVPIYEVVCPECGSTIHYKAFEVVLSQISCPVCNVKFWASTFKPVMFEPPKEGTIND